MNPFWGQITTNISFRVETSSHSNIKSPKGIRLDSLIGRKSPIKALICMKSAQVNYASLIKARTAFFVLVLLSSLD